MDSETLSALLAFIQEKECLNWSGERSTGLEIELSALWLELCAHLRCRKAGSDTQEVGQAELMCWSVWELVKGNTG